MWKFDMRYHLLLYYGLFLHNLEKGWRVEAAPVCFCCYCLTNQTENSQTSKDSDKTNPSTKTNNTLMKALILSYLEPEG